MTNTRDSFIFYRSFYQASRKLPKEDKAEIFDAICSYALDGEEMDLSLIPEAIFTVIKPNLDANRERWKNGCKEKKNKQTGSKPEANPKQSISEPEANKDKDVNKDVNVNLDIDKNKDENNKYTPLSEGLFFILEEKLNKSLPKSKIKSWSSDIRKLIEIDLKNRDNPFDDVKGAIQSIADNYGKDYFPVIQSGQSLRDKITKIENYSNKNKPKSNLGWLNK